MVIGAETLEPLSEVGKVYACSDIRDLERLYNLLRMFVAKN